MFDIAIVGSGFGGSLLAMIARRLGFSVLLLERGKHPRFAVGESTSPLANLLLEQIAMRYDLPRLLPLTRYGTWQKAYPEIGCGVKRGFSYFFHEAGREYRPAPDRENQLLVAASPDTERADTHWLRADVDAFLVREAIDLGADYREETRAHNLRVASDGTIHLDLTRNGKTEPVSAGFLVDASGPRGLVSREMNLPEAGFAHLPPVQTLYSHFTGVRRFDEMVAFHRETPPYPVDDAALHHIFDGGWMWVLRFVNGTTSAGVVLTNALAQKLNLGEGKAAWHRFLARFPSIKAQFARTKAVRPFTYAPRVAHRSLRASGKNWALLPSSAAFVDPLFSTGIPLTLLGIKRLGRLLEDKNGDTPNEWAARLRAYGHLTLAEADGTAQFIAACYAAFPRFENFAALSMFYFAAASYSEIAHRIGSDGNRFLLQNRPDFAAGLRQSAQTLRGTGDAAPDAFAAHVACAVAPVNIAGLCNPAKRNWYGVDLNDVICGAEKLGLTPTQMRQIIASAPWA